MMQQIFNYKRIIWESKQKQILSVTVSFLFVAVAIWTRKQSSPFYFWSAILLFGSGGLFYLLRLLNPNNLFVTHDSELGKQILAEQRRQEKESLGSFIYTNDGFTLAGETNGEASYKWSEIETIFRFKIDHYATDDICLDIFTSDNRYLQVTESTAGWYQFERRLSENIPSIANNWVGEISVPAFQTRLTLLFDRKGRTQTEAEANCYPQKDGS
jgi:hypothetical protein